MFTSIAIIGRPNVGKSSLFNKLTRSRDAIVSDFPGLTKDRNHGFIKLKDKETLIIDTGGIVNQKESIKEAISNQAWIAVEESSLIILLLDGTENLNKEDLDIIYKLRKLNKDFITVINKIDKKSDSFIYEDLIKNGIFEHIKISAEHSKNLNILKSHLENLVPDTSIELPEGKKVAILGRPNAGKSTFINKIINEERLIVSEIAGTTIDSISVPFEYNNHKFIFIDTAGIRKGYKYNHKVEYFSYVRAIHAIEQSDIVIFICDATEGIVDQDLKILNMVIHSGKPILFALNKTDLLKKEELAKPRMMPNIVLKNQSFSNINLSDDEQREKIINDLKTIYEDYWKMFNQINTSIKLYLNIKVENLDNLKIMSFEKNLMSIDLINDFFITKFDKDHTYYQIVFNGTLETFLKTMNFYNYDFDTQNKIWVLR